MTRRSFATPRRIVVKIGSSSLTGADGRLDEARVRSLASEVAAVRRAQQTSSVIVTSGAIAAGLDPLGFRKRPSDIPSLQAAASVGQGALIHAYQRAFARSKLPVGQVLLTQGDFVHRDSFVNAHHAIERLLGLGAVPVVNENDATGVAEIRFGDNDRIAALVAMMIRADLLIILSDVDGIYTDDPRARGAARLETADLDALRSVKGGTRGSHVGSGGMASKVEALRIAATAGIGGIVAAATEPRVLRRIVAGEPLGTYVPASRGRTRSRKAWIAFAQSPRGVITVDDGARRALIDANRSLLPAGIVGCDGGFVVGDVVEIRDAAGEVFARGITSYAADEVSGLLGQRLAAGAREVIHRDSLVLL